MIISRETVRRAVIITGALVLASYVFGVSKMEDASALWGGIPESWRALNTATMFVAAAGFLIIWWFMLYGWDIKSVDQLRWPWSKSTGGGQRRLLLAFMLVTIPSMFWLELTAFHMRTDAAWTQWLVIGNLWLVCLGNLLLGLFAWSAHQQGVADQSIWPVIGSVMLGIQVIVNDGILWNLKYPW